MPTALVDYLDLYVYNVNETGYCNRDDKFVIHIFINIYILL